MKVNWRKLGEKFSNILIGIDAFVKEMAEDYWWVGAVLIILVVVAIAGAGR